MSSVLKFLSKRVLPFIAANIELDIDTVIKKTGVYLRLRVEVFDFKLIDRMVPVSEEKSIPFERPVDVSERAKDLPPEFDRLMDKKFSQLNPSMFSKN